MDGCNLFPDRQSPWMPFESRRRARDEKREAVLRTAVALFLEQGYHGATLNDVAERLNITKPALYNYFRSKDEILFECWAIGPSGSTNSSPKSTRPAAPGSQKLRKLIHGYAEMMTTDFGNSLVRFESRDLTEHNRKTVRPPRRRSTGPFATISRQAITDGSIKPCDAKLSAFAIAGSLNWIGHWYQRDGALEAEAIASQFAIA